MGAEVRVVEDIEEAKHLAAHVRSTARQPLVVVSTQGANDTPLLDVASVHRRLDGSAEVVLLKGAETSYAFKDAIGGPRHTVHSGWVRVYPVTGWDEGDQHANRIAVFDARETSRIIQLIEERVNRLYAFDATPPTAATGSLVPATAQVIDTPVAGGDAVTVRLLERTGPNSALCRYTSMMVGLPPERLLQKGMRLEGFRDTSHFPTFIPSPPSDNPHQRVREIVGDGRCLWVYVEAVSPDEVTVLLHPLVPATITGDAHRNLTFEFSPRACIGAFVIFDDSTGQFVVDTAPFEETVHAAVAVFPGGPPWLVPTPPEEPLELSIEIDDEHQQEYLEFQNSLAERDEVIKRLKAEVRVLRGRLGQIDQVHTLDESFRRDLALAYFRRLTSASDRATYPLREDFEIVPGFFDSAMALVRASGISWDRIVAVCAMVACHNIPAITTKRWDNFVSGLDMEGWTTYRANLQTEAHSARRLRYSLKGQRVRFESTSLHDGEL